MKIKDLSRQDLASKLSGTGLRWATGPFHIHLKSSVPGFSDYLHQLYGDHPVLQPPWSDIADFHLQLNQNNGYRRLIRPQVFFQMDGVNHLAPFPLDHAPPLFEWGWNFVIAGRANHFLILHTAVVAKGNRALILPGVPGSGKSTLCAALALRGWRLLSDEFALIRPDDGQIAPLPRPVALKNQSIEIIREFDAQAVLGPEFPKTRKGTVSHLKPPGDSVEKMSELARPGWVIFPHYQEGQRPILERVPPEYAFLRVAANAFNYETLGGAGFNAVGRIVRGCELFDFRYGNLADAVETVENLLASSRQSTEATP
ncbi:MAG: HprK-related kinase A [Magnetococcales bacterium]|nr:HprK-related kinase A [Magnetococcales bacterium]